MLRARSTIRLVDSLGRLLQFVLWPPVGYLLAVTLAALRTGSSTSAGATDSPGEGAEGDRSSLRFVVLVPAHDEEHGIAATVRSIAGTTYPSDAWRTVVVADNCTDRTAEVAQRAGAEVWERFDASLRGKGAAVAWAVERLLEDPDWTAVVMVDADTSVDPVFLPTVASRMQAGVDVLQGRYQVADRTSTVVARLADVSFAVQSVLRPLGRARLGASAKLQGNGMAFSRRVLEAQGWRGQGLTEDAEQWLQLLQAGVRPQYEPAAIVSGAMPTDLAAARVQRFRWEAGRAALVRRHLRPGLKAALARRDPVLAEALISELVFPPLATLVALVFAGGGLRWSAGRHGTATLGAQAGVIGLHVLAALRAAKAPPATWATLALAPVVVAWKLVVKAETLLRGRRSSWQRTPRAVQVASTSS